jgi:hypothetical protein
MNRGKPGITRRNAVVPVSLERCQELPDRVSSDSRKIQAFNPAVSLRTEKSKQEYQRVAIAMNCVPAHPSQRRQIILEKSDKGLTEFIGIRAPFHHCSPWTR